MSKMKNVSIDQMNARYRLDKMVSGQWEQFKAYPHTIQGMDEAFHRVDDFTSEGINSRVIDTETGKTIVEVNL